MPGMLLLRTFLVLLSVVTVGLGTSACATDGDGANDSDATTTTGVTPDDVQEPGDEGEDVPADPTTPATNPGGVNY